MTNRFLILSVLVTLVPACGDETTPVRAQPDSTAVGARVQAIADRVDDFAVFRLETDLERLSHRQRQMLPSLIDAARIMDDLFWEQAFGADHEKWLASLPEGPIRELAVINYGPWDRLAGNEPFIEGTGPKPPGANFYPTDMTVEEFEAWDEPDKRGPYSLVRRDEALELVLAPYHVAYADRLAVAAARLREAAQLADDEGLRRYLELRAEALVTDDYRPSDFAWMAMETNDIDVIIGAIEIYEDQLFGYRAAYEAYVLVKDRDWTDRLERFARLLPALQRGLPVPERYRSELPGSDSDLGAYDAVYYAGQANEGAKAIAVNLPNDEAVQLEKGTRRLQLKNAMRAKFEKILLPISEVLVAEDQRHHVTFDAFFSNVMFHEVAHGLGIKNTIGASGTVRAALKDMASILEEGKADVLGLYMITELHRMDQLGDADLMDYYVTFLASIFRSVRFGSSSAHGKANMVRFNFFADRGAFSRDSQSGTYRVDFDAMQAAMTDLSARILILQGDGDYEGARALTAELGVVRDEMADDLRRLTVADIPVDIRFVQGAAVLGL